MNIWDNFAKKVTDAADYTIKEAEKFTGAAKIKFDMAVIQKRIDDIQCNVGALCYDNYKTGSDHKEEIDNALKEIETLYVKLEDMKIEHAALKNYKICAGCSSKIDREAVYCPKCGLKQEQ